MTGIMPFPENNILFYWAAPQRVVLFLSIAKAMVYHHAARVYLITEGVYHQPQAVLCFRNDDIQFLRN